MTTENKAPAREKKIAYQGEVGSNSDIACRRYYPQYTPVPFMTFEDCFSAVGQESVDMAMIPIENSVAGRVADIHHLLPNCGLFINGERFLPIHFCLAALAGASLENLERVQSHIHALGQCRNFINHHKLTPIVGADTAGSAREIAEKNDQKLAALCTREAAEIYGLDILAENAESRDDNVTRFVILERRERRAKSSEKHVVTSLFFRVRNVSAALYKALGGFATNGINLTKLESYQTEGRFFVTQFYLEIEGHPENAGMKDALAELKYFCDEVKILGVYSTDDYRRSHANGQILPPKA